jgi:hypothetical protein
MADMAIRPASPRRVTSRAPTLDRAALGSEPATSLTTAIRDLTSERWRELLATASEAEIDGALEGVVYEPPTHPSEPGVLRGNALFTGRGASARPMASRLRAFLGLAPGANARVLRESVVSLDLEAKAGLSIDVAPLADYPNLAAVVLKDASRIDGARALAHVPRVTLWRIAEVDLAAIPGPPDAVLSCFDPGRVLHFGAAARPRLSLTVPAGTSLERAASTELSLSAAAGVSELGPIGGAMRTLRVRGAHQGNALARVLLGDLPQLESIEVSALRTLREVVGLERLHGLERVEIIGAMAEVPELGAALRSLAITGPLTDARALAQLPSLSTLRLFATARSQGVPGLEAIGAMKELESLELGGALPLAFLTTLPSLPRLTHLALEGMELERLPELAHFAPALESLSLLNTRGYLEHDALTRLPKLKRLFVPGSTLAKHRSQLDPRLARAGVEIDHGKVTR